MSEDHYVQPSSRQDLEAKAYAWRDALSVDAHCAVPDMTKILEISLRRKIPVVSILIKDDRTMGTIEAYTQFEPPMIVLRESVYKAAAAFDRRARMTLAHELGHLLLHKSAEPLNRAPERYKNSDKLKPFASAEYQANVFGAAFLVPEWIACEFEDAETLSRHCCVSLQLASIRLSQVAVRQQSPRDQIAASLVRDWNSGS